MMRVEVITVSLGHDGFWEVGKLLCEGAQLLVGVLVEEGHLELEVPGEEALLFKGPLLHWLLHDRLDEEASLVLLHFDELLQVYLLLDVLVELRVLNVDHELLVHLVVLVVRLVLMCLLRCLELEFFVELLPLLLALTHLPFLGLWRFIGVVSFQRKQLDRWESSW